MTTLLIAEHDNHSIKPATLNAVTAAAMIGGSSHLMIIGTGCTAAAQQAAGISGVDKVLRVDAPHYADPSPENIAAAVLLHAAGYSHVLAAATTTGKAFMPRVAAQLDVAQISEIVAVNAPDIFIRPIYAGSVLQTVQSSDPVKVITVRTTAFTPAALAGGAHVETVAAPDDLKMSRLLSRQLSASERPELSAARVVVSGGRGLASGENYHRLLEPLADKLGAALGASRAAVDAGFVPNDYQIGQTGKIVAPQLYIAVGISGAIQHLAGMKESRVIVAINKDGDAPIFQVADYGLVGDLFELVPELTAALS